MGLLGLFRREDPVIEFDDQVIDDCGQIWPAYTDKNGVLVIDVEEDVYVVVKAAIVDGEICKAWIDDDEGLQIDMDAQVVI